MAPWSRTAANVINARPMMPNKKCAAASGMCGPSDDERRSSISLIGPLAGQIPVVPIKMWLLTVEHTAPLRLRDEGNRCLISYGA
jgi:hypothetical protein